VTVRIHIRDAPSGAELAAGVVQGLVAARPDAVIGFATGSTPVPLYAALARRKVDFSRVTGFALDEYVGLERDDPASYRAVLEELRCSLGLAAGAMHVPDVYAPDLDEASADYENSIATAGGIDLQIVGIGANGHLGFNEPGTPFASRTRVAALEPSTREANARFFPSLDDVPRQCITQGLATIFTARQILLLVSGRAKARALHRALEGPVSESCPASVLRRHPSVYLIADPAAAAMLTSITKESSHDR
jgi:glucosamine-6-phosphate deaminase